MVSMETKACWRLQEAAKGISVIYHNLVDSIEFDCGTCTATFNEVLHWIASEAAPGDLVVLNGHPVYHISKGVTA